MALHESARFPRITGVIDCTHIRTHDIRTTVLDNNRDGEIAVGQKHTVSFPNGIRDEKYIFKTSY